MKFSVLFLSLVTSCSSRVFPVGQTYAASFGVPLMGRQCVRLQLLNRSHACVTLEGLVSATGMVAYQFGDKEEFAFELDGTLSALMRRYGCRITDAFFDASLNRAEITLHVRPLLMRKRLHLEAIPTCESTHRLPELPRTCREFR